MTLKTAVQQTTASEVFFFILKHLDATKLLFLSVFTIIETICPKIWADHRPKMKKDRQLPVDVRPSKTSLLKGAVSRNSAKLGNYKMPVKLRET